MRKTHHTKVILILAIGSVLLGRSPVLAAVRYVRANATGANNGTSWTDAYTNLQDALTGAVAGDEVWVAAGTYVERITLKEGVALYDGFAGEETELAQRSWVTQKTVLDGNQEGSVVTARSGITRIDGFTITNGRAPLGGGIYCESSSPTIIHNTITANIAAGDNCVLGGGIYCHASSATIADDTIAANSATGAYYGYDGGICCVSYSSATIMNNYGYYVPRSPNRRPPGRHDGSI